MGVGTLSASVALKSAICLSTLTLDSRPWWQVIQRASPSSDVSTFRPEGKVTEVRAMAAGLWQVTQSRVPAGAGTSVAVPLATKSWKPTEVWHLAQAAGTTAGSESFQ